MEGQKVFARRFLQVPTRDDQGAAGTLQVGRPYIVSGVS